VRRALHTLRNSGAGRLARNVPSLIKLCASPSVPAERKRACLAFYAGGEGVRRLFATLPRSGFHYLALMIDVALDLKGGGSGAYTYDGGEFHSAGGRHDVALDWRWKLGRLTYAPVEPYIFHSHMPYYRNTCWALPAMRTVVMVRNVWDAMESLMAYHAVRPDEYDAFLAGRRRAGEGPDFPFSFQEFVRFFDSWGAVLGRRGVMALRYEDLIADPVAEATRVAALWDLEIPGDCIERAVELCSKDRMKAHLQAAGVAATPRVRFDRTRLDLTPRQADYVRRHLRRGRYGDFGYALDP